MLGPENRPVACGNENSIYVIDTKRLRAVEKINTAMYPLAPVGSTPNALALDPTSKFLFVANADNNNVAVIHVGEAEESNVMGFIPTTWYPSAVNVSADGKYLFVGSSKGLGGYAKIHGPHSPIPAAPDAPGRGSSKSLQRGSVSVIPLANLKTDIKAWTKQSMANSPTTMTCCQRPRRRSPARQLCRPRWERGVADQARALHHQREPHVRPGFR
jgi:hypothetical protein